MTCPATKVSCAISDHGVNVLAIAQSIAKNSLNIDSLAEYLGRELPQLNRSFGSEP